MICKACGTDKDNIKLSSSRDGFKIPFACKKCGNIKVNYTPTLDRVFLWPYPHKPYSGAIYLIEDDNFKGGGPRERLRPSMAVVLAFGKGHVDSKKKKFIPIDGISVGDVVSYNKKVPWKLKLSNDLGEIHAVTVAGFQDISGVYSNITN